MCRAHRRAMRREVRTLHEEHREHDEADRAHASERDAPAERAAEREAHDRRERIAELPPTPCAEYAWPSRRGRRSRSGSRSRRMEDAVADAHQDPTRKEPDGARRDRRAAACRPPSSPVRSAAPVARRSDRPGSRRRTASRRSRHRRRDERAEQRPGDVELGAQERKQRRQRELEEMRERVRDTDNPMTRTSPRNELAGALSKTVGAV